VRWRRRRGRRFRGYGRTNLRFAVTRWWWLQSGANPSLSTCQPVDTHTVVDKRRLTLGGSSYLSNFPTPLKGPHVRDLHHNQTVFKFGRGRDNRPSFYKSPRTEYQRENQLPTGEVAKPGLRRTPGMRIDSEGARGFKSASLRQAGSDLRAPMENLAKFAQVRGFPQP
jgi:hypothetical protein